jgi:hypothetical protein
LNDSLVKTINPKTKHGFHACTMLFYILENIHCFEKAANFKIIYYCTSSQELVENVPHLIIVLVPCVVIIAFPEF